MFDFEIRDNLIITKGSIVAVFEIEPVDVSLFDVNDQISFFSGLATVFNVLQGDIQFNVVMKRSSVRDFGNYFKSLKMQNLGDDKRIGLVENIIADMEELIENPEEQILTKTFYFQIKEECTTSDEKNIVEAVKALSLKAQRTTGSFIHAGLAVGQVKGDDLHTYIEQYY